ncbi:hypothetical protein D3C84_759690 [compost metagenome]
MDVTNNAALSWSSSDPTVATISSTGTSGKGLATGVAVGTTTLTASGSANGTPFSATAELTVNSALWSGCALGTVTAGGLTYTCPLTQAEADANGISYTATYSENGLIYVRHNWGSADAYCTGLGSGFRLPSKDELVLLFNTYGNIETYAGWPTSFVSWSSTEDSVGGHYSVGLGGGSVSIDNDSYDYYVSCVR